MQKETIIKLSDVNMAHHSSKALRGDASNVVLTNLNLEVSSGEMMYLIGKIGSGKSTFLKTLYGELPLMEGSAEVVGYDLKKLRRKDVPYLRRKMGVVFQDLNLLPDRNVYENLYFVLKATGWKNDSEMRKRIDETLEMVNLSHKIYKMPHHLSGGEQQRLAIGRAFLNEPKLILADEPTRNLDPQSIDEVLELFIKLKNKGCSIIIATHDILTIKSYLCRTIFFDGGTIKEVDMEAFVNNN